MPKLILSLRPINFVQTLNYQLIRDRLTVAINYVHILQFHTFFSAYFTFRPFQFVGQHTDHNRNLAKEHELAEWIEIYGGVALGVAIETFSNVLKIMFIHREVWKTSLTFSFFVLFFFKVLLILSLLLICLIIIFIASLSLSISSSLMQR